MAAENGHLRDSAAEGAAARKSGQPIDFAERAHVIEEYARQVLHNPEYSPPAEQAKDNLRATINALQPDDQKKLADQIAKDNDSWERSKLQLPRIDVSFHDGEISGLVVHASRFDRQADHTDDGINIKPVRIEEEPLYGKAPLD